MKDYNGKDDISGGKPCEHCGYCPHCGQAPFRTAPAYPYPAPRWQYIPQPYSPWPNYITCGTNTSFQDATTPKGMIA